MLQIGFRARSGNFLSFAETFNQALIFRTDMLCGISAKREPSSRFRVLINSATMANVSVGSPRLSHARDGGIGRDFGPVPRGIHNTVNLIPLPDSANRRERHADAGERAGNNQGLSARLFHFLHKRRIILY